MTLSTRSKLIHRSVLTGLMSLIALVTGCLNPEFLNQNARVLYPVAPGDEPFVLIWIVNDTPATIDIPLVYDDGLNENVYQILALSPEVRETGILLEWPVLEVAIGDLDDPWVPSMIATFPDGTVSAVPFGNEALVAGSHFQKGDALVFYLNEDSRSDAFISVGIGKLDAEEQPPFYTRADPFEAARLLLILNGF